MKTNYSPFQLSKGSSGKLRLELGDRSYEIFVGCGLLDQAGTLIRPFVVGQKVFIVSDTMVAPLYLKKLQTSLEKAGIKHSSVTLASGEKTKSFEQLQYLCNNLLKTGVDRETVIIALGGGVIGDITGFCAAVTLRGIDFIQIPTTLLSQVDSSVGGKTGINSSQGKNLIGAFHQPRLVITDLNCLDTLPRRHLLAGYAEIVKYGLINDIEFFDWLEKKAALIIKGDKTLQAQAILKSCASKADIVARDERENDIRALLNLGHTFAHALEAETGYNDDLLHGEAVSIGISMAYRLSQRLGFCKETEVTRIINHFNDVGLPTNINGLSTIAWTPEQLISHMEFDKKVKAGKIAFILAQAIGATFISREVKKQDLLAFLTDFLPSTTS